MTQTRASGKVLGELAPLVREMHTAKNALARSASPALVARHMTELPDKALLQAKLDEFYTLEQGERE